MKKLILGICFLVWGLVCKGQTDTIIDGKTFTFHYLANSGNDSTRYCDYFKGKHGERIYFSASGKITSRGELKLCRVTRESRRYYGSDKYSIPKKVVNECGNWTTYNEDGSAVTVKIKCRRVTIAKS